MYSNLFKNEIVIKSVELTNNIKNLKDENELKKNEKNLLMLNKLLSYITKYELYLNDNNTPKKEKKIKNNNDNNNTF